MIIKVTAKISTTHPKYGRLVKGEPLRIEKEDFTEQLFSKEKPAVKPDGNGGVRR